ncbi:uncharacterized protein BO97DRAFT_402837 [Aspergillus homomorphus CBS 101889]|uniref:Uncharacterized protein n=1 Tax=Aspergillus homomorphus (strain CBS 101889) TaxID=1450537 RepID=A0A395I871_ASPHC|nr:hypothetical protein BO97DRAFT_402837 [Aspergillus homomorphus CBS 101889]RAL16432.1 hypothetical protein BO97DRAFT_402837 [Aspergillus homomorphus CBS 101889]
MTDHTALLGLSVLSNMMGTLATVSVTIFWYTPRTSLLFWRWPRSRTVMSNACMSCPRRFCLPETTTGRLTDNVHGS